MVRDLRSLWHDIPSIDFSYRSSFADAFVKIILTSTSLMLTNSDDETFQKRCRYILMQTLSSFS